MPAVAIIAAAGFHGLLSAYLSETDSQKRILSERGQIVLDALKAGILAHGRMGRYRADRLSDIFEELASGPSIVALQLRDPKGTILVSSGNATAIPNSAPSEPVWKSGLFILSSTINFFEDCQGQGRHRFRSEGEANEAWESFVQGNYQLIAVLDAAEVESGIARHTHQFLVSVGLIIAVFVLTALTIFLLLKRSEMAGLLEKERETLKRKQIAAQLGAGLAHETKNPLGIIRGMAQSIAECSHKDCPVRSHATRIVDEVDRVIRGINSFLALSRPQEVKMAAINLDHFFSEFLPLVQMDALAAHVSLHYEPCGLTIFADEDLLRKALLNLLLNALQASQKGQTVRIITSQGPSHVTLHVVDSGCGIAPEILPHITEPYFSRSPGGSGLGLAIVSHIAEAHGWKLQIDSTPGKGTEVSIHNIKVVQSAL